MQSPWLAYVPRHVALEVLAGPAAGLVGRTRRFPAVALFADVSGFTAMSEALAQAGRQGAEELTGLLNRYFEPMIARIESYGGVVAKFGGDALTVLFPFTARTRRAVVRRALQCALDMQAAMGAYARIPTSAGVFSLAMKAGLAAGPVLCTTVGDPAARLEYLVAGTVLDRCADAEHHAAPGEVVVADDLLPLSGAVEIAEARGGFTCLRALKRRAAPAPLPALPEPPAAAVPILARFIHPSLAARVAAGLAGFINEHRQVTVLFVSFTGFDYDHDPGVSAKLQAYLDQVIAVIQRYDGYLNKVDMGDKGSKYIVLFGTPVAHEDDAVRAVRCALELRALPYPARIGVNGGLVYCGQVGSAARQEYTVIGDAVNLAARLMQAAAPGQILVSAATQRPAAPAIAWEALAPLRVKGKAEPVPVFLARGPAEAAAAGRAAPAYTLPLVGRAAELATATAALERAAGGAGRVLGVCGEAGLGKSRLAAALTAEAEARGFTVAAGAAQSFGQAVSYLAWRAIWHNLLDLEAGAPAEVQARQAAAALESLDPRLLPRLPLLGAVLNLPLPDNDLTRPLDAQLRTEALKSLLLDALRRRVARGPLMIVLDDCHWLDPLSQDLLAFLGRNAADLPLLLLALYRPLEPEPLAWGQGHAHVGEIRLRELDPAEAEALIGHKLRQLWGEAATLPPALRERLAARAQGNPFYLEELLNFLRDRRGDPGDPQALAALEIPESLQSLILSRIDQLAEAAKTSLKVASVIGRVFRASWLWGSTPAVGAPAAVREHLEALSRLDLTPLSEPEPELAYMFKHITTQEVAYESLAYATRAALHEAVAGYVEQAYPAERAQFVDVLAFHYGRSANAAKQREYFRLAGDAAKAVYANAAAVDYYQRLLPLLPEAEQAAVRVDLGEVWQLTGEWAAAEAAYRQALAQAGADQRLLARAQAQLGSLLARTRSFDEALRWLREAQANCEAAGDRRGLGKVMEHMSFAHWNQGDFDRARTCAQLQLAIAAEHGDAVGMSGALDYLGITALRQGRFAEAVDHLQRAITTAQAAGYWRGAALAYNDLAGAYFMRDDFANALTHLQQALAAAGEIGYLQMQGAMLANASSLYKHQGEYAQALACCSQALRIALELGDQPGTLTRLGNLARIFQAQARAAEAERLFRRAIDLARALKLPNVLCTNLCDLGRLYLAHGRLPEALEAAEAAAAAAGQVNDTDTHREAEVLAVRARAALGALSPAEAGAALQAWLAAGELEEPDRALLHLALWQVDPARTADRAAAAELYAGLYAAAPVAEYADRYYALTGERLPAPPPLPPPPAALLAQPVDLPALLARAGVEAEAL